MDKKEPVIFFSGVPEEEVFDYFKTITNVDELPAPVSIIKDGVKIGDSYPVDTDLGQFRLRNHSTSGDQTGAKWTIDVPGKLIEPDSPKPKNKELKFR